MDKIGDNHWRGDCFEIKVICGAFFIRVDYNHRDVFDRAKSAFQKLWIELGSIEPVYGQMMDEGKSFPSEEEVMAMIEEVK